MGRGFFPARWIGVCLVLLIGTTLGTVTSQAGALDCEADWQRLAAVRQAWRHQGSETANNGPGDLFFGTGGKAVSPRELENALTLRGALPGREILEAEVRRLVNGSRDAARLDRMFAALDDDPDRIRECLAAPLAWRRRARELYRADTLFHAPGRDAFGARLAGIEPAATADSRGFETMEIEWRRAETPTAAGRMTLEKGVPVELLEPRAWSRHVDDLALRFDPSNSAVHPSHAGAVDVLALIPSGVFSPVDESAERYTAWRVLSRSDESVRVEVAWQSRASFDSWVRIPADNGLAQWLPVAAVDDSAVSGPPLAAETDCTDDTWTATTTAHLTPEARERHTAVWTGAEMIVFGGRTGSLPLDSGAAYDPALDTWATLPFPNGPSARFDHTAIWTGTEMIVWGGFGTALKGDGAAFDPALGSWTALPTAGNPPIARSQHTTVWTDSLMLVWGGQNNTVALGDGAAYDPGLGTWTTLPTAGDPPAARYLHSTVWTGTDMIVWGGVNGAERSDGARLDLASGTWTTLPDAGLLARRDHTAVWTGERMLVWGGAGNLIYKDGAGYSAADDAWTPLPDPGTDLSLRHWHSAIWTGFEMVIWGGLGGGFDGARYHEATGNWRTMGVNASTPTGRKFHTAVWTGGRMIIWGGSNAPGSGSVNTGGLYCAGCLSLDWHPDVDGDTYGDTSTVTTACDGPTDWILDGTDCDDALATVYPGAPGICDGLNNDCSSPSWPGLAGTEEFDNDTDGFSLCAGDCLDADPTVWGTPGESRLLQIAGDERTLSWSEPLFPGADAPFYDVLRSPEGGLWDTGNASCLVTDDAVGRTADDPDEPGVGAVLYYLTRAGTPCGKSGIGSDSQSTSRSGRTCP